MFNFRITYILGTLLVASLVFIIFPINGKATEAELNFYVTPEFPESQIEGSNNYFDLNLEPGAKETLSLKLQNAKSTPIKIQVTPHTAYTNVNGVVEYGRDAQHPDPTLPYSLDKLIKTSDVIELAGNETKSISVSLHMPKETFEGFLAGGLRISEVKEDQIEEPNRDEGVAIKNEFAYVVGVIVSNTRHSVRANLDLIDVFPDQLNYRNVVSATIQNYMPTFVNRLSIEATVQRSGEDDILYKSSKEMMQMAPNSSFNFPISLEGERFVSGEYVLKLHAKSSEDEWKWERSFIIEADQSRALNRTDVTIDNTINWWMISAISLCLLLILIFLGMIKKRNKGE